jgi:hypothetical protein
VRCRLHLRKRGTTCGASGCGWGCTVLYCTVPGFLDDSLLCCALLLERGRKSDGMGRVGAETRSCVHGVTFEMGWKAVE